MALRKSNIFTVLESEEIEIPVNKPNLPTFKSVNDWADEEDDQVVMINYVSKLEPGEILVTRKKKRTMPIQMLPKKDVVDTCKTEKCKKTFVIKGEHVQWFIDRNLSIPRRCEHCRKNKI